MVKISCKPHLINTLIKESQAGVFIADKRALLDEAAEHLGLDHERVKPLMGAVAALQEAWGKNYVNTNMTRWYRCDITKRHVHLSTVSER